LGGRLTVVRGLLGRLIYLYFKLSRMTIRTVGIALASLVLISIPVFASAQVYNNACGNQYSPNYNYNYSCGPQTLLVYVQVTSPITGAAYNAPSNFTVSVEGNNPSPATFSGSLSGTAVNLGTGSYSVSVSNLLSGFTASYSAGCTGAIYSTGQGPTCVITMTSSGAYYSSPTPYPYPYVDSQQLTCAPAYQTINAGQSATFTAIGGTQGTLYSNGLSAQAGYNWQTSDRSFLDIGPTLTTVFQSTGVQSVVVSNGTQTASCTVNIVGAAAPIIYSNTAPIVSTYIPPAATYIVPTLPDTGFEPQGAAAIALAIALLGMCAIAAYPYVKKISLALLD
jgi:hypothetical protein